MIIQIEKTHWTPWYIKISERSKGEDRPRTRTMVVMYFFFNFNETKLCGDIWPHQCLNFEVF